MGDIYNTANNFFKEDEIEESKIKLKLEMALIFLKVVEPKTKKSEILIYFS